MLLEFFVIGLPSFFLSLQPNKNRVQGKFLPYVLSRAIPCAIVLVLAVQSTRFISAFQPEYFNNCYEEVSTMIITFAGLVMLYRVCIPFNLFRTALFIGMCALCITALAVLPAAFLGNGYTPLGFVPMLYIIVVVLISVPLSGAFIKIFEKLRINKKIEDRLGNLA